MKVSIITITILFIVMAAGHAFGQAQGGGCPMPMECKPTDGGKNPTAGKGVRIGKVIFKATAGEVSSGTEAEAKRRPRPTYGVPKDPPRKPGPVIKFSAHTAAFLFADGASGEKKKKKKEPVNEPGESAPSKRKNPYG